MDGDWVAQEDVGVTGVPMTYDDIVIGAGSSGAVLAARLSEDAGCRVMLLEAGPDYPSVDETPPDLLDPAQWGTSHDWGYAAEVVPGRSVPYPRGKVTGGSSAVNGAFALRGAPADFDEWAAWGNDAWGWAKVLPYFCRLEDDPGANPAFHGVGGPIPIERRSIEELTPTGRAFLEACRALGFPSAADLNDPASTGAGPAQKNLRAGRRVSTALAYFLPACGRANLAIRADALVDRIVFDGRRAVQVEIAGRGGKETVSGRRITMSAGAIGSPAILLRSGVGPAADLRRLGIEPLLDLPGVGANLIDHAVLSIGLAAKEETHALAFPRARLADAFLRYTAPRSEERNDMQAWPIRELGRPPVPRLVVCLMRPRSRGVLRLTDRHPGAAPEICLNLASDPEDRRRLRGGSFSSWSSRRRWPRCIVETFCSTTAGCSRSTWRSPRWPRPTSATRTCGGPSGTTSTRSGRPAWGRRATLAPSSTSTAGCAD